MVQSHDQGNKVQEKQQVLLCPSTASRFSGGHWTLCEEWRPGGQNWEELRKAGGKRRPGAWLTCKCCVSQPLPRPELTHSSLLCCCPLLRTVLTHNKPHAIFAVRCGKNAKEPGLGSEASCCRLPGSPPERLFQLTPVCSSLAPVLW